MQGQENEANGPEIAKVAKGKRPQYFSDPATDKLLNMVLTLAGELSVARDRLDTLERLLDERGVLDQASVDAYKPDSQAAAQRSQRRAAYLERVMRTVQMELEQISDADTPASRLDVIKQM